MDPYVPKNCPVNEACQFSSPLISTEQFKEQCLDMIGQNMIQSRVDGTDEKALADQLQTDEQTLAELKEVCNIDKLTCDYDQYNYYKTRAFEDFPNDCPLETVKLSKVGKTKTEELYYPPNFLEPFVEDIKDGDKLIPPDEVLIYVTIFHPIRRRVQQQFYVHANQNLSELRDVISCPADNILLGEFSNNIELKGAKSTKELSGSSFFFVEQVFYNDTRNPLFRDYSKIIIDWAKDEERYSVPGLGLFTSNQMQNVKFKDLTIRLGYPYLFCHQGNCEHILVFTDMRIVNEMDVQKADSYPVKIMNAKRRRCKCSVCNIHIIKWKTMNDNLAFEDPSYFCDKCFRYLHYTEDGKKLYPFEAYPCLDIEY